MRVKKFTDDKIIIEISPNLAKEISLVFKQLTLGQNPDFNTQRKYEQLYNFFNKEVYSGWLFYKSEKRFKELEKTPAYNELINRLKDKEGC